DFSLPIDPRLTYADGSLVLRGDDEAVASRWFRDRGVESVLCLPFVHAQQLVGAIYLGTEPAHRFSEDQMHLLRVLSARVALAITKQQAHTALQQEIRSRDDVLAV